MHTKIILAPLNFVKQIGVLLSALLICISINAPASAQIQVQIGGDEGQLKAFLTQRGYDRIETRRISLLESSFFACKGEKRYRVSVNWNGGIRKKEIGNCRIVKTQDQILADLKAKGYERINIEDRSGNYLAIVCKGNNRSRLQINQYGDVTAERAIGRCERILTPTDITARLQAEGYNRINFTDRQLPTYVAEACVRREKFKLEISGTGEIQRRTTLGSCRRAIRGEDLTSLLQEKGLTKIVVTKDSPPRYQAVACRGNDKVEVSVNRYGQVIDEYRIGRCKRRGFTVEEITSAMTDQGYKRIQVKKVAGDNFNARGCLEGRLNEIVLSRRGRLVSRKELGGCNSPKMHELADILRKRGMSDLEFSVTACESGSRNKIIFDEYANRVKVDAIGSC